MMDYTTLFAGVVVSCDDPVQIGRIKVRVPAVHGISTAPPGMVPDSDLPWCLPGSLPAGGSAASGGFSWLPVPGDQVWVRFIDGQLDNPVWQWGNQSTTHRLSFGTPQLHQYEGASPVKRGALTRYGHWLEFKPGEIDIWTKGHYRFDVKDGEHLRWSTPQNYSLTLSGTENVLRAEVPEIDLGATGSYANPNGPRLRLGYDATDPVVRLSDLVAAINAIKAQFDAHVHRGVDPGDGISGVPTHTLHLTATGSSRVLVEARSTQATTIT